MWAAIYLSISAKPNLKIKYEAFLEHFLFLQMFFVLWQYKPLKLEKE